MVGKPVFCVGDYDNDGWDDLFCTFWGHNILFFFTTMEMEPSRMSLVKQDYMRNRSAGAQAVLFSITTETATSIFLVRNHIKLDPTNTSAADDTHDCQWKGIPIMCGPRGLPGDTNILYHNNGDGAFTDVSQSLGS